MDFWEHSISCKWNRIDNSNFLPLSPRNEFPKKANKSAQNKHFYGPRDLDFHYFQDAAAANEEPLAVEMVNDGQDKGFIVLGSNADESLSGTPFSSIKFRY